MQFRILNDGICSFCSENETIDHLCFDCKITHPIWQDILKWTGYTTSPASWSYEKE